MSERQTGTHPARGATAHDPGRDERAHQPRAGRPHAGAEDPRAPSAGWHGPPPRTLADRAAEFRHGAPFLVDRASLYDPEPLREPPHAPMAQARFVSRPAGPGPLLPAALTLLGVVMVVGLAAGVLFLRHSDLEGDLTARAPRDALSQPAEPSGGGVLTAGPPNAESVTYDLTRRPNDMIVGAWRLAAGDGPQGAASSGTARRPLPRRMSLAPPDLPLEDITRPVMRDPQRHDAPEPRRQFAEDGSAGQGPESGTQLPEQAVEKPVDTIAQSPQAIGAGENPGQADRQGSTVVARVGRAAAPLDEDLEEVELPVRKPAPPRRRASRAAKSEKGDSSAISSRARRARMIRQLRRGARPEPKRAPDDQRWVPEALYGNRYQGMERQFP